MNLAKLRDLIANSLKVFDTSYCRQLASLLETRHTAWVQEQLSCVPNHKEVLEVVRGNRNFAQNLAHCQYQTTPTFQDGETTLPFQAQTFDAIVAVNVLEFVQNANHLYEEVVGLLKPNGQLIYTCLAQNDLTASDAIRFYTQQWHIQQLHRLSLDIEIMNPCGGLFSLSALKLEQSRTLMIEALSSTSVRWVMPLLNVWAFNLPILILWQLEKLKLLQHQTVGYMVVARKKSVVISNSNNKDE